MKIFDNDGGYGLVCLVFVLCTMILIIVVAINYPCSKIIYVYKNYSVETIYCTTGAITRAYSDKLIIRETSKGFVDRYGIVYTKPACIHKPTGLMQGWSYYIKSGDIIFSKVLPEDTSKEKNS